MYQRIEIIGHLGRNPEMRYTQDGTPVTTFSVATSQHWMGAGGERQEKTTWFRVTAWRKLAETCNEYLAKGRLVFIEGTCSAHGWLNKQTGEANASIEITARNVKFLGKSGTEAHTDQDDPAGQDEAPGDAVGEEEIPF